MNKNKFIDSFPDGYIEDLDRPDLSDREITEIIDHNTKVFKATPRLEPIFQLKQDFKEYKSGYIIDFNKDYDKRFGEYYSPMTGYCLDYDREFLPWGSYKILNCRSQWDDRLIEIDYE